MRIPTSSTARKADLRTNPVLDIMPALNKGTVGKTRPGGHMSEPLTERQGEILKLIKELTEVSGFPPTRAEIATRMGFRSVNAAEQHLRALERKGALDISAGPSRGIKIRERAGHRVSRLLELPVIGRVAAGSPILAEEH